MPAFADADTGKSIIPAAMGKYRIRMGIRIGLSAVRSFFEWRRPRKPQEKLIHNTAPESNDKLETGLLLGNNYETCLMVVMAMIVKRITRPRILQKMGGTVYP